MTGTMVVSAVPPGGTTSRNDHFTQFEDRVGCFKCLKSSSNSLHFAKNESEDHIPSEYACKTNGKHAFLMSWKWSPNERRL